MHVVKWSRIMLLFNELQLPANDVKSNLWYITDEKYDHDIL